MRGEEIEVEIGKSRETQLPYSVTYRLVLLLAQARPLLAAPQFPSILSAIFPADIFLPYHLFKCARIESSPHRISWKHLVVLRVSCVVEAICLVCCIRWSLEMGKCGGSFLVRCAAGRWQSACLQSCGSFRMPLLTYWAKDENPPSSSKLSYILVDLSHYQDTDTILAQKSPLCCHTTDRMSL